MNNRDKIKEQLIDEQVKLHQRRETFFSGILSWNSGAQRIYGYSADEITGKPVSIRVTLDCPDDSAYEKGR